jgi:hypothetical protein
VNLRGTNVITTHTRVILTGILTGSSVIYTHRVRFYSTHDLEQYHAETSRKHTINSLASQNLPPDFLERVIEEPR